MSLPTTAISASIRPRRQRVRRPRARASRRRMVDCSPCANSGSSIARHRGSNAHNYPARSEISSPCSWRGSVYGPLRYEGDMKGEFLTAVVHSCPRGTVGTPHSFLVTRGRSQTQNDALRCASILRQVRAPKGRANQGAQVSSYEVLTRSPSSRRSGFP